MNSKYDGEISMNECGDEFAEYWDSEFPRVGDVSFEWERGRGLGFERWKAMGRSPDGWIDSQYILPSKDLDASNVLTEQASSRYDVSVYQSNCGRSAGKGNVGTEKGETVRNEIGRNKKDNDAAYNATANDVIGDIDGGMAQIRETENEAVEEHEKENEGENEEEKHDHKEEEEEEEEEKQRQSNLVYSIIHGRRIDMTERGSTKALYKKILRDMGLAHRK